MVVMGVMVVPASYLSYKETKAGRVCSKLGKLVGPAQGRKSWLGNIT